jgi:hypothetical protein
MDEDQGTREMGGLARCIGMVAPRWGLATDSSPFDYAQGAE